MRSNRRHVALRRAPTAERTSPHSGHRPEDASRPLSGLGGPPTPPPPRALPGKALRLLTFPSAWGSRLASPTPRPAPVETTGGTASEGKKEIFKGFFSSWQVYMLALPGAAPVKPPLTAPVHRRRTAPHTHTRRDRLWKRRRGGAGLPARAHARPARVTCVTVREKGAGRGGGGRAGAWRDQSGTGARRGRYRAGPFNVRGGRPTPPAG